MAPAPQKIEARATQSLEQKPTPRDIGIRRCGPAWAVGPPHEESVGFWVQNDTTPHADQVTCVAGMLPGNKELCGNWKGRLTWGSSSFLLPLADSNTKRGMNRAVFSLPGKQLGFQVHQLSDRVERDLPATAALRVARCSWYWDSERPSSQHRGAEGLQQPAHGQLGQQARGQLRGHIWDTYRTICLPAMVASNDQSWFSDTRKHPWKLPRNNRNQGGKFFGRLECLQISWLELVAFKGQLNAATSLLAGSWSLSIQDMRVLKLENSDSAMKWVLKTQMVKVSMSLDYITGQFQLL